MKLLKKVTKTIILSISIFPLILTAATDTDDVALDWKAHVAGKVAQKTGLPEKLDLKTEKQPGSAFLFYAPHCVWGKFFKDKAPTRSAAFNFIAELGASDIIFNGGFSASKGMVRGRGKSPLAPRCYHLGKSSEDELVEVAKECQKRKLGLWVMMHGMGEDKCKVKKILEDHRSLYAKDTEGNMYFGRKGKKGGGPYDIISDEVFEYIKGQLDNTIDALRPYECLKGFFWDEFWFNYMNNYLGGHYDKFVQWCEKNYGQTPPPEIKNNIASKNKWHELNNIWWRRYVIWRAEVIFNFENRLFSYINSKGYKLYNRHMGRGSFPRKYAWRLGKGPNQISIGNKMAFKMPQRVVAPNAAIIMWSINNQTGNHTTAVTGHPAAVFTFWRVFCDNPEKRAIIAKNLGTSWLDRAFIHVPRLKDEIAIIFRDVQRWFNAKTGCRTAVLMSDRNNIFEAHDPFTIYATNTKVLLNKLAYRRPMKLIDRYSNDLFNKFNAIIAVDNSLKSMSEKTYQDLLNFVKEGGTLITLNAPASTSKPDGSQGKDVTPELSGVTYGKKSFPCQLHFKEQAKINPDMLLKLRFQDTSRANVIDEEVKTIADLKYADGTSSPGITVKKIGKGKVIGIHFYLNRLMGSEAGGRNMIFTDILNDLLRIYAEKSSPVDVDGAVRMIEFLKKDGSVGMTFKGDDNFPISGKVKIKPGILKENMSYTVKKRSRGIDEFIPGPTKKSWSTKELAEGITVTISPERKYEIIEIDEIR